MRHITPTFRVERQQSDRAEIRKRLENFIAEGRGLLGQIKDAAAAICRRPPPTNGRSGRKSICATSSASATVARFRKDASELYGDDPSVPAPRLAYWRAVRNRVVNLEAIGAEFAEQPWRRP